MPTQKSLARFHPLQILLRTNGLVLLAGAMFAPIMALFVEEIGGTLLDASFAGAVFAISAGLMTFVSGLFSDKVKETELVVVLGYGIMAAGFFGLAFASSVTMLLIAQVVIGFGEALYAPAFDALYSKHINRKTAGKDWGTWESMNYMTAAIGAVVGGLVVTQFGFSILFLSMALLCFGSGLSIFVLPRKVL